MLQSSQRGIYIAFENVVVLIKNFEWSFKIARRDSSQDFMDTVKTIDLTRVDRNNQCSRFVNHTHIRLIKKPKTKNM